MVGVAGYAGWRYVKELKKKYDYLLTIVDGSTLMKGCLA